MACTSPGIQSGSCNMMTLTVPPPYLYIGMKYDQNTPQSAFLDSPKTSVKFFWIEIASVSGMMMEQQGQNVKMEISNF